LWVAVFEANAKPVLTRYQQKIMDYKNTPTVDPKPSQNTLVHHGEDMSKDSKR
jgi:hypothetical protein